MSDWPRGLDIRPLMKWHGKQTGKRTAAPFSAGLTSTLQLLDRELAALHAKHPILQVMIPPEQFRIDGRPRATAKASSPAIILTFDSDVGPLSYPCDRFTTWQDNLRAIALALEALRKVDRYGVTSRGEQYSGFLSLESAPATSFTTPAEAEEWLRRQVGGDALDSDVQLWAVVRRAKRLAHPDTGGTADAFQKVIDAERLASGA